QFDSLFKSMKNDIKSIVYDIITERKEIDLAKFKSDLDKLESIYELSIDETRYKISDKAKIDDNLNKLKKMQIIFTDLSSIKALNSKSCINEKNKSTLEEMLKMTLFVKCDNETSNEDIIYNYHLSSLLKNLASLN
ncbi:hypothetical protein P7M25_26060, partial [Vibrio parahaemolyticus]|nr:hypothetical protein [Vibrio parahaemolyticus]